MVSMYMYQQASCAARIHSLILHTPVIFFYDTLLTFPREVECIWKRKWSAATALFLLNRYSTVVLSILNLLSGTTLHLVRPFIYDSSQSIDSCRGLQIFVTLTASDIQNQPHSCESLFIIVSICGMLQLLSVASSFLHIWLFQTHRLMHGIWQYSQPFVFGRSLAVAGFHFSSSLCLASSFHASTS